MEKSIESIWKEGFLKGDALIAPKLNDLYGQKSVHIIDKLLRMLRINHIAVIAFGAAVALVAAFQGLAIFLTGAVIFLIMGGLAISGFQVMKKMEQIDKGTNSYDYLVQFKNKLYDYMEIYRKVYRFAYPAILLDTMVYLWFSGFDELILVDLDAFLYHGLPIYWIIGASIPVLLMAVFSDKLFKLDIAIVYGRIFKKLDEMVADMEELRA